MKVFLFALICAGALIGCGGGGSSSSTSGASDTVTAASCNQTPTLGSTSFGNGCFK